MLIMLINCPSTFYYVFIMLINCLPFLNAGD